MMNKIRVKGELQDNGSVRLSSDQAKKLIDKFKARRNSKENVEVDIYCYKK